MYNRGYDYFSTKPGIAEEICCKICGEKCDVMRNEFGPTSYVSAIAGYRTYHDAFYCPNNKNEWHNKAYELIRDIEKCNSDSVRTLMKQDLERILRDKS